MTKPIYIRIPTFKARVFVLCPCDSDGLAGFVRRRWKLDWSGHNEFSGRTLYGPDLDNANGGPTAIIALKQPWQGTAFEIGVLAHECAHAAAHIMTRCGVKSDGPCEPTAYLIEQLVRESLEALAK
jgi:hypothetical protein